MDKRLLISGAGTGETNNLIRSLRAGDPSLCIIGCHSDRFVLKKSAADRNCLIPSSTHPRFPDALRHVIEQEQVDLVIPNSDADVKAVEILMRSKSMPQTGAFAAVYAQQMASKQTLDEGKTVPLASHPDPCRKMSALLAAYPAEQAFVDRLKQNPKAWVCRP